MQSMFTLKQKKLLLIAVLLSSTFFLAATPFLASARGLVPCGGYNADGTREPFCNVCDMFSLVALVTNWLIAAAGVYAVFQIFFAGFKLIIATGEEEKITQGRSQLTNAVIGFVLVMISFIIINTVVDVILYDGKATTLKVQLTNPFNYLNAAGPCQK
jgi:hypothetical protein